MSNPNQNYVSQYVEEHIGEFHAKRLAAIKALQLEKILKKKNPYLFRAKHLLTSEQIVRSLTEAFLSSQEETIFGDWLEGLAIFINEHSYGGRKSGIPGIDLEFDSKDKRYIVSIKSGPNWGNSSQIAKLKEDFRLAKKSLRTSGAKVEVVAVNGCCYGRDNHPDKGEYFKYCGQRFWTFISGDPALYVDLIEPLSFQAQQKNEAFALAYAEIINVFTREFTAKYCTPRGSIDWQALIEYNSQQ